MIKSTIYGIWFDKMLTSSFLALKWKRQVYYSEFEFSLLYIVSSTSARSADSSNWSEKREETPTMCVIWVSLTRYCTTCRFSYNHSLRMKRIRQCLFMLIYELEWVQCWLFWRFKCGLFPYWIWSSVSIIYRIILSPWLFSNNLLLSKPLHM